MPKRRQPYHERLLRDIKRSSSRDLEFLADQIMGTLIPKGHDEIISAWKDRMHALGWHASEDLGVPDDLLLQKQEAAEREAVTAK